MVSKIYPMFGLGARGSTPCVPRWCAIGHHLDRCRGAQSPRSTRIPPWGGRHL